MPLAIFCGCTARFVLDLVGIPEDRFCRDAAFLIVLLQGEFLEKQIKKFSDQKVKCGLKKSTFASLENMRLVNLKVSGLSSNLSRPLLIIITPSLQLRYLLYSKRIYSANGISRSFFSSHKCFFKTYKNAFKWNASNWD